MRHAAPSLGRLYARALAAAVLPGGRGDTLPDTECTRSAVPISTAHLAAYGRVCGFRLGRALPLTYPHVLAFPLQMQLMADRRFPLALPGMVHVANRIRASRAIPVTEQLDLQVRAEALRPHPKGAQVDLVAQAGVAGEPVWESRSTYLSRGATVDEDADNNNGNAPDAIDPAVPAGPASARWTVDAGTGRRYAAVSGDVNPIHLHRVTAMAMGFPRSLAHGMWTAARAVAALEGRLPEAVNYEVAFRAALLLPARVELVTERDGDGWLLAVRSTRSTEKVHLAGRVS